MADVTMPAPPAPQPEIDVDALVDGLTSLGFTRRSARSCLDAALERLATQVSGADGSVAIDESNVLHEALRLGAG